MIKLERGERPKELTEETCEELKRLYAEDNDKAVWNSSKIKEPLKKALLEMSHGKCVYCECKLEIESKDATIDHFLPKSKKPDDVVKWENLFPSCLRCNRKKNNCEEKIINPCEDEPRKYLGITNVNRYRFKAIDTAGIGKATIEVVGLNDIERVMTPKMQEWEILKDYLIDIEMDLKEEGFKRKYKNRFKKVMERCLPEESYAATKATNILNDVTYNEIKSIIVNQNEWTDDLEKLEKNIKHIALELV